MKRSLFAALALLLALVSAVPVSAAGPELLYEGPWDVTFPMIDCNAVGVGDFLIWDHTWGWDHWILWRDKDGEPLKERRHIAGTDVLFRMDNPDRTVSGHWVMNWHEEDYLGYWQPHDIYPDIMVPAFSTLRITGAPAMNIQAPGFGPVLHWSGNYFVSPDRFKFAGLFVYDPVALCQYFAD